MTTAAVRVQADDGGVRDDDAVARPTRRRFSAVYKLSILDEYEFRVRRDAQMAVGVTAARHYHRFVASVRCFNATWLSMSQARWRRKC